MPDPIWLITWYEKDSPITHEDERRSATVEASTELLAWDRVRERYELETKVRWYRWGHALQLTEGRDA